MKKGHFQLCCLVLSQESIPSHLATSPILLDGASLMESQLKRSSVEWTRGMDCAGSSQNPGNSQPGTDNASSGSVKKRRKLRRKSKLDNIKRDDNGDTTEEDDMFTMEMSSEDEMDPLETTR